MPVEFFPSINLQNGHVDSKRAPEPESTGWLMGELLCPIINKSLEMKRSVSAFSFTEKILKYCHVFCFFQITEKTFF